MATSISMNAAKDGEVLSDNAFIRFIKDERKNVITRVLMDFPALSEEEVADIFQEVCISVWEKAQAGDLRLTCSLFYSYLGVWLYHMGLLTMYRANDIVLYVSGKTHMFVYLISSDSTSYETELAYLESCGVVDDSQRFEAYCYDIGEAVIYKGKNEEQRGSIIKFGKDEYLHIYRIDTVNDSARENYYDLSGDSLISSSTDLECVTVKSETKIAITGVVKPYQMNRDDYTKRPDNTYEIKNRPSHIRYTFRCGDDMRVFDREINMTRFDKKDIGDSVFEFYNLFDIDSTMKGKRYSVSIRVYDEYGALTPAASVLILNID